MELKDLIKKAAKIHEESWNGKEYKIDIAGAVMIASGKEFKRRYDDADWVGNMQPAYLLLVNCWNDALELANE